MKRKTRDNVMSEIAIRTEGLGKLYKIGQRERENARNVLGPILTGTVEAVEACVRFPPGGRCDYRVRAFRSLSS